MIRSCTLLVIACACGFAADEGQTSIRFALAALPTEGTYKFNDNAEVDQEWDTAGRFSVSAYRNFDRAAPVSFLLGAGLAFSSFDTTVIGNTTYEDSLVEVGVWLEPGMAINLGSSASIELGVQLGVGSAEYEQPNGDTFDGSYAEFGLVVRPVLTFESVLLFAELGYVANSSTIEDDADNELTTTVDGAMIGLGLGVTF